jgi:hypothetical protein
MISSPVKTQFESLLHEQHLIDDLSVFAGPDYFDEVPLFSRYKQIDFLKQYGDEKLLIIELALDYLDHVTSSLPGGRTKRLAAITVISDDGGKHLVPHIFICNGEVERRLADLRLTEPTASLGKQVQELVDRARPQGGFRVFADHATVPGDVRVFVAHAAPPEGFVALEKLLGKAGNES